MERDREKKKSGLPQSFKSSWGKSQNGRRISIFDGKGTAAHPPSVSIRWRIHSDNERLDLFFIILLIHVQCLRSSFIKNLTTRMRKDIEQVDVGHI